LEEGPLAGAAELLGRGQRQPARLDALMVLGEGDEIGASLFIPLIVTHDAWPLDTHLGLLRGRVTGEERQPFYRSFEVPPSLSLLS